ncbi:uncharacterized protein LOC121835224 [Ixodes scapularis]|uniref:uncharacterized protein LOC121835224 n=1 Tax=Ixodes scapularis TaxID=6945 RepID=UPI001C38FBE8|nr:uncharacterized protein LOC121835224 [Ixodes scapularis]
MGRKCFAPRCKTGYKSCSQKLSLFCAPKDEERLKVWRNAIPRKDRVLQSSDSLCERHFETHFVSKTWEAVYNGNVLISTPRKASLSKDAVPTKFPDCPTYLSKETKRRKRPAERHNRGAPAKKPCTENRSPDRPCQVYSDQSTVMEITGENDGAATTSDLPLNAAPVSALSTFNKLFESPECVLLPSAAWGFHRLQVDDLCNLVFSELRCVQDPQCAGDTTRMSHMVTVKLIDIDQDMRANIFLMGKRVSCEALGFTCEVSTIEDVESLLGKLEGIHLCGGGPTKKMYPEVQPECAFLDACGRWRHKKCVQVLPAAGSSQKCAGLTDTLRIHQRRAQLRKQENGARTTFRLSSLANDQKVRVTFRRAQYALKRAKDRLVKRVKRLEQALKTAQNKFCSISDESLQEKLSQLNIPAAQLTVVQETTKFCHCLASPLCENTYQLSV